MATQPHPMAPLTHDYAPHSPLQLGVLGVPLPTAILQFPPSPTPISGCPTPSSIGSIVDYEDDNYSVAIDIYGAPPSQSRVPSSTAVPINAPSPMDVKSGSDKSAKGTGSQPSMFLQTAPKPFIDKFQRVVAAVPGHAPKPMNILPDWWF